MSKIFDAIKKSRGDLASLVLPLVNSAGRPPGAPGPAPDSIPTTRLAPVSTSNIDLELLPVVNVGRQHLDSVVMHSAPASVAAERFRLLQIRLRELTTSRTLNTLMVSSALPADGKSTVALNLATALAEKGERSVLLVDSDLHRGRLNSQFGLDGTAGFGECLLYEHDPFLAIRRIEPLGIYFLSAGVLPAGNPTEALRPKALNSLVQAFRARFDWVVLDTPPVLALTDAVALAEHVDGSILVARAGFTPIRAIEDAISLLGRKRVLGLVLNGVLQSSTSYSSYQQYYRRTASADVPEVSAHKTDLTT